MYRRCSQVINSSDGEATNAQINTMLPSMREFAHATKTRRVSIQAATEKHAYTKCNTHAHTPSRAAIEEDDTTKKKNTRSMGAHKSTRDNHGNSLQFYTFSGMAYLCLVHPGRLIGVCCCANIICACRYAVIRRRAAGNLLLTHLCGLIGLLLVPVRACAWLRVEWPAQRPQRQRTLRRMLQRRETEPQRGTNNMSRCLARIWNRIENQSMKWVGMLRN